VNEESYKFAATGTAEYPFVAPEGGKEPLRAEHSAYTMGSDHDVYQDSSFGIPAIYLNDWPDRYIHTNLDTAANIDPTKLKRAAFIGAASGYFLARAGKDDVPAIEAVMGVGSTLPIIPTAEILRVRGLSKYEACVQLEQFEKLQKATRTGLEVFFGISPPKYQGGYTFTGAHCVSPCPADGGLLYRRGTSSKGPLAVFGYDYFGEHRKSARVAAPKLLSYEGLWGAGEEYAYEVLNFADGKRQAQEIRDAVSAEYGPVPLEMVVEYLRALEKIGMVELVKQDR